MKYIYRVVVLFGLPSFLRSSDAHGQRRSMGESMGGSRFISLHVGMVLGMVLGWV